MPWAAQPDTAKRTFLLGSYFQAVPVAGHTVPFSGRRLSCVTLGKLRASVSSSKERDPYKN